jgi:hypothetical protein
MYEWAAIGSLFFVFMALFLVYNYSKPVIEKIQTTLATFRNTKNTGLPQIHGFRCFPGVNTPIRTNEKGQVQCLGKYWANVPYDVITPECAWTEDTEQCLNLLETTRPYSDWQLQKTAVTCDKTGNSRFELDEVNRLCRVGARKLDS